MFHDDPLLAAVVLFDADEVLGVVLVGEPAFWLVRCSREPIIAALLPQPKIRLREACHRIAIDHLGQQRLNGYRLGGMCRGKAENN